jgi:sugar-specific transcriptional regulator TrmB
VFDRDLEAQLAKLAEATREAKTATSEAHSVTKQLRLDMREARQKVPEVMDAARDEAAKLITAEARKYLEAKLDAMVDELARDLRKRLGLTD